MTDEKREMPELQFDRAEPIHTAADGAQAFQGPVQCSACGSRLLSYYSVNGKVTCKRCRDAAVATQQGSHLPTLATAAGLGLLAAIAGAIIYFAVAKITGYEIGFVSIVVGLLVGKAVRKGARGRGGWRYQALAILLCYLSIASSYFAFAIGELVKRPEAPAAETAAQPPPGAAPSGAAQPDVQTAAAQPSAEPTEPPAAAEAVDPEEPPPSGLAMTGALLLLLLQLPVLVGKDNPMTFLLIGIALFLLLSPRLGMEDARERMGQRSFFLLCGLLIGFYDGFFGPGTGTFWAMAFVLGLGFNLTKATGYTKAMNFASNIGSLVFFMGAGSSQVAPAPHMA